MGLCQTSHRLGLIQKLISGCSTAAVDGLFLCVGADFVFGVLKRSNGRGLGDMGIGEHGGWGVGDYGILGEASSEVEPESEDKE